MGELQLDSLGKKVFFLYPPSVIKEDVSILLSDQEYEIYLIRDYDATARLLVEYPNSIVFVNIDEGQSESEWELWIRRIMNAPVTAGVGIGIVSYNADEGLMKKYLMDIGISCGFVKLKLGVEQSSKILLDTLKANEAKGRRRYVRANCANDQLSKVNIRIAGKQIIGHLKDISAVGFSCVFESDPDLAKNSMLNDIQLKLRGTLIRADALVFGTRQEEGTVYVLLFTPKMDGATRTKIRRYIQYTLQSEMDEQAKTPKADTLST